MSVHDTSAKGGGSCNPAEVGRERACTSTRRPAGREVSAVVRVRDLVAQAAAEYVRAGL